MSECEKEMEAMTDRTNGHTLKRKANEVSRRRTSLKIHSPPPTMAPIIVPGSPNGKYKYIDEVVDDDVIEDEYEDFDDDEEDVDDDFEDDDEVDDYVSDDDMILPDSEFVLPPPERDQQPRVSSPVSERWQPDTNSFHLPFGEMTIMLHDVRYILQVPIKGKCLRDGDQAGLMAAMASLLGLSEIDLDTVCLPGTKANWIKSNAICVPAMLKRVQTAQSPEDEAKIYLMCLLGTNLLPDKSSDRVRLPLLQYLKQIKSIKEYAWGAAALAWMYRELGVASHPDPRDDGSPLAGRWDGATDVGPDGFRRRLEHYRRTLDEMHAGFVTWLPFHKNPGFDAPDPLFRGVIHFVDVAEHYDPSRVLRQFGYVQVIPEPRIEPEVQKRPVRGVSYTVTFSASTDSFWGCKTARISLDKISVPVDERRDAPEYMSWYLPQTHLRIIPPTAGVQIQLELPLDQAAFQIIDGINPLLCGEGELSDAEIVRNYRSVVPSVWRMFREFRQRRLARPFHG
ncbi:Protein MAIN-LIKE 2 [Linum grandiflorum]